MRKTSMFLGLLAAVAFCSGGQTAMMSYKASLNGASEVPPTQSKGTGSAQINADNANNQVSWRVEYSGLSGPATGAHIHCGAPAGGNAGVAVNFGSNLASPISGSGTMTPAQMADLQGGKCYVNVHTDANKGGEIRGQLMP